MKGWIGKRLRVYLTEGKIVKEDIPEEELHRYVGGLGLGANVLFNEVKPGIDPLGSENVFIIGAGPFSGTCLPCSGRWTITTKSPQTGGYGDGSIGGDFGAELKFAGLDQIVIYGRSPKPVYLWINDDTIELREASHLWGKDTWETHHALAEELGDPEVKSAVIGPAGENLVRTALIVTGLCRTAGRGGLGAVLGSKNMKAVVVRGRGSVEVADVDAFDRVRRLFYKKIKESHHINNFKDKGTLWITRSSAPGFLVTRNGQSGFFEHWENFTSSTYRAKFATKKEACFACAIACGSHYVVKDGPYASTGKSPEFGAIAKYMSAIDNENLEAALYALTLCNKMGLDAISAGSVIGFAMEAWEKGLITAEDTDQLDLSWGNVDAAIELTRKIAHRDGFGNVLADGSRMAAERIEGSKDYLCEVKGMEWISSYPGVGAEKGRMLALATSTRGADHLKGFMAELNGLPLTTAAVGADKADILWNPDHHEGRGTLLALENRFRAATDSLGMCWFSSEVQILGDLGPEDLARGVSAVTGLDMDEEAFMRMGERAHNLQKAFNVREGIVRKDDTIPKRFLVKDADKKGIPGVDPARFREMLDEYYEFSGWDMNGRPTRSKLDQLDLGFVADRLGLK
ncbi:MAG: aldehyde ferredoxin oxidoreductase family protein [Proteobacteria bacterium]|nr:aldehyde ferredoxin oxidoreductase family protein [Pseudomonadota bacterium]